MSGRPGNEPKRDYILSPPAAIRSPGIQISVALQLACCARDIQSVYSENSYYCEESSELEPQKVSLSIVKELGQSL